MRNSISITDPLIESKIYLIRGQKVMLDSDLAEMYGAEVKRLKEQVRRNIERFPEDFMFELTNEELKNLRSHFATSSWGGRRYLPYAFSEHGVLMLSSVLKSEQAVQVNIQIMRVYSIFDNSDDAKIIVQEIEQIAENKVESKKDVLSTKEDLLVTKQNLIDRIHRAKTETIIWIVSIGVLQCIASLLAKKYM